MRILSVLLLSVLGVPAFAGPPNGTSGNKLGGFAGYMQNNASPYTQVQASWRIPVASFDPEKPGVRDLMYQWVGIDSQGKLIQTGIREVVNPDGSLSLEAWYECLPAFNIVPYGGAVQPGDIVTASVVCTANCRIAASDQTWTASIRDATQNWTATQTGITCATGLQVVYPGIIETNANGGSIMKFEDIPFSDITVNFGNPSLAAGQALHGFAHGGGKSTATANPSDPNKRTDGFKLCWGQGDAEQAGNAGYANCPNAP